MTDLQKITDFLFLIFNQIAVLYTNYFILAAAFSVFVLRKVVDLLHKVKN